MRRLLFVSMLVIVFISLYGNTNNPVMKIGDLIIYEKDIIGDKPFDSTKIDIYRERMKHFIEKYAVVEYLKKEGKIPQEEELLKREWKKAVGGGLYDDYVKKPIENKHYDGKVRVAYEKSKKIYVVTKITTDDLWTALKVRGLLKCLGASKVDSIKKVYNVDKTPMGTQLKMELRYGRVNDNIFNTVYGLNPGDVSWPLKLKNKKYAVYYVWEIKDNNSLSYDEFKEKEENNIKRKEMAKKAKTSLNYFKKGTNVKYNDDNIDYLARLISKGKRYNNITDKEKKMIIAYSVFGPYTIGDFFEDIKSAPFPPGATNKGVLKRVINNMLIDRIIQARGKERGIDVDPETIHKYKIGVIRVLGSKIDDRLKALVKVSDEEIKEHYEKHKKEYYTPAFIKADEIGFKHKEMAEGVYKSIKTGKETFDKFFKIYAVRNRGNDNYFETQDSLIYNAIKNYKVGDITKPVKDGNQYSIFRIKDKIKRKYLTFEHWKGKIYDELKEEKKEKLKREIVSAFEKENVKFFDPVFEKIYKGE